MSNALPTSKSSASAVETIAKKLGDKARTHMYSRVNVEKGRAAVTNGHVALFWGTSAGDNTYTLDGGIVPKEEVSFPDVSQIVPSASAPALFSGRVALPKGKDNNFSFIMSDKVAYWAVPAACPSLDKNDKTPPFGGANVLNTIAGKYLEVVAKFFESDHVYMTIFSAQEPVLFTLTRSEAGFENEKFAVVMGCRV
jgi:hypothetical protein